MAPPVCPRCGNAGKNVLKQTVESMLKEGKPSARNYWLCLTPDCPVAYFSQNGEIWLQENIRVPIGFKTGATPKYVCYCSEVTEQDIINAVLSKQAVTLADAIKITGAMKNGNCRINNPSGICCSTAFKEVFDRALRLKKG